MKLNQNIAQDIVENISTIIDQDINLMDDQAMIIASTDKERIGAFHGGAKTVLSTKDVLTIYYDGEYEGAKAGINLPIAIDEAIVAVIGITGEGETIWKFGHIIKKMTEILIREHFYTQTKQIRNEKRIKFFDRIFVGLKDDEHTKVWLEDGLRTFHMDKVYDRRIVLIGGRKGDQNFLDDGEWLNYTNTLDQYLSEKDQLFFYRGNLLIVAHEVSNSLLLSKLESLREYLEKTHNLEVNCGVGNVYKHILELKDSFEEARLGLKLTDYKKVPIQFYEDLDIDMLLDFVPKNIAERYIEKVLGSLDDKQIEMYQELMRVFIETNGSVSKAAELQFMHKNTFQYRLNKLASLTGYNPRQLDEMIVLYMALRLKSALYL